MTGFQHSIAGGQGNLVVTALKSPNFVHGSAGWSVNKDGSAEFNNGTFRGTLSAGTVIGSLIESAASGRRTTIDANGDIKVYSASGAVLFWLDNADNAQFYYADTGSVTQGALTQSIAVASGTDPFSNAYLAGNVTYKLTGPGSAMAAVQIQGTSIACYTAPSAAGPWTLDTLIGFTANTSADSLNLGHSGAMIVMNSPISNALNAVQPGNAPAAETWHTMTLLNSWAAAARITPKYRFLVSPPNTTEIIGSLTAPAGIVAGQIIWNLPTGYTVSGLQSVVARNVTTNAAVMLSVVTTSTQTLQYQSGAVAGDIIDFHAFLSQDA